MDFSFTPEQEQFRQEVRAFCRAALEDEQMRSLIGVGHEDHDPILYHKIAERGWIGMQWPREFGGHERSRVDMCIFYEEMNYARARIGRYTGSVVFVGESIVTYGTAQQKAEFLPRIARGELTCCWGLTEPGSVPTPRRSRCAPSTRATTTSSRGQKVFTSGAHLADMGMFAVRTDPSAPKYHGISLLLIDMNTPGITLRPLHTLGGWRVNETYLDGVIVPKERLMGQQNEGWKHVLTTLGFERSGIASVGAVMRTADDLAVYMAERAATGQPVAQAHQDRFADLVAQLHAARLMGYRVAWMQDQALPDLARSSMVKVLASDLQLYMANLVGRRPGPRRHRPGPRSPPRRPRRAPLPRRPLPPSRRRHHGDAAQRHRPPGPRLPRGA